MNKLLPFLRYDEKKALVKWHLKYQMVMEKTTHAKKFSVEFLNESERKNQTNPTFIVAKCTKKYVYALSRYNRYRK